MNGELAGRLTVRYGTVPTVSIDPEQIKSVIVNLVHNARDAIGEASGHITVETLARRDGVTVVVSDTGPGMSPDFIEEKLFRPFQTTKKQGIGIGLFQCKTMVDAHGGQIDVTSRVGTGTTFRVFLPAHKGKA
jgi:signal transduction histidine kinase